MSFIPIIYGVNDTVNLFFSAVSRSCCCCAIFIAFFRLFCSPPGSDKFNDPEN